jgi:homoserine/homoserine lactone efflux protein
MEDTMNWQTWVAYTTVVFIVIITPGPAAALCMTHAAVNGRRRTLFTIAGLLLSSLTLIGLSAVGLGAALAASGTLFTIIKFAGAAYLVYLGIQIWRSPPVSARADHTISDGPRATPTQLLRTGYLVGASNPKDLLFFGALFPQFMNAEGHTYHQLAVLSVTWLLVAGSIMFCYAVMGFRLAAALDRFGPKNLFNRLTGGALIAAGAFLAAFRRSSS